MTTITIERELLEQALNALLLPCDRWNAVQHKIVTAASDALLTALAAPATAPEHLEWPEFEPWAQYVGMNVSKDANGYYTSEATDMAWQAWEMAKNQKMTVGPPATAPEQPSWHDAPTCAGLWWVAGTAGIFHIDEAALPIYKGSAHRWFGPIPPDSGDKS